MSRKKKIEIDEGFRVPEVEFEFEAPVFEMDDINFEFEVTDTTNIPEFPVIDVEVIEASIKPEQEIDFLAQWLGGYDGTEEE